MAKPTPKPVPAKSAAKKPVKPLKAVAAAHNGTKPAKSAPPKSAPPASKSATKPVAKPASKPQAKPISKSVSKSAPAPAAITKVAPKAVKPEIKAAKPEVKTVKPDPKSAKPALKPEPVAEVKKQSELALKTLHMISEGMAIEEAELTASASFKEDLGLDDLDIAELLMLAEETFNIPSFSDDDWEGCETVADLITLVETRAPLKSKKEGAKKS